MEKEAAWRFSVALASEYGRPIVTGIGVAEEQTRDPESGEPVGTGKWYVRVDFHNAENGRSYAVFRDSYAMLRDGNETDKQVVAAEYARMAELNKQAMLIEQQLVLENAVENAVTKQDGQQPESGEASDGAE